MRNLCGIKIFILLFLACAENPLEPSGVISGIEEDITITDEFGFDFGYGDSHYGSFKIELIGDNLWISSEYGVIDTADNLDVAPENGYDDTKTRFNFGIYYFLITDDKPHYAKVRMTKEIAKQETISFQWWLQREAGNRVLG